MFIQMTHVRLTLIQCEDIHVYIHMTHARLILIEWEDLYVLILLVSTLAPSF